MATSTVKGPGRVVTTTEKVKKEGDHPYTALDGACMDSQGYYWVATFCGKKLCRIDPKTGEVVKDVYLKTMPSSCQFGGPDMKTLFVTNTGVKEIPGAADPPNGGFSLITFEDDQIQGVPMNKAKI